jgi:hypothetical protein
LPSPDSINTRVLSAVASSGSRMRTKRARTLHNSAQFPKVGNSFSKAWKIKKTRILLNYPRLL